MKVGIGAMESQARNARGGGDKNGSVLELPVGTQPVDTLILAQ